MVKASVKAQKKPTVDEKAETLWEIFEKTGSIGAYLLYMQHIDDNVLDVDKKTKNTSR